MKMKLKLNLLLVLVVSVIGNESEPNGEPAALENQQDEFIRPVTIPFFITNRNDEVPAAEVEPPILGPGGNADPDCNCESEAEKEEIATPYGQPINYEDPIRENGDIDSENVADPKPYSNSYSNDGNLFTVDAAALPVAYESPTKYEINLNSINDDSIVVDAVPNTADDEPVAAAFAVAAAGDADANADELGYLPPNLLPNNAGDNEDGYQYPKPKNPMVYPLKNNELPVDAVRSLTQYDF